MTLLITAIPNLGGFVAGGIVMWIVLLAMYFTPTIIAVKRLADALGVTMVDLIRDLEETG